MYNVGMPNMVKLEAVGRCVCHRILCGRVEEGRRTEVSWIMLARMRKVLQGIGSVWLKWELERDREAISFNSCILYLPFPVFHNNIKWSTILAL